MDLLVLVYLDFVTGAKNLCFQDEECSFSAEWWKLGLERTKASLTIGLGAALLRLFPV